MSLSIKSGLLVLTAAFSIPATANNFNLQSLIDAAKTEAPITVYDSTGKIRKQAKAFTAKYGVKATGIKAKAPQIIEIISREAKANNVQADVIILADAPAGISQLLTKKYVTSWVPDDLAESIPATYKSPLTVVLAPNVWTYNTGLYDSCPITNIWQLTQPQWKGKVALQDPLGKPSYTDWFNQTATHHDQEMSDAYTAEFGSPLKTTEDSATAAFVKAFAKNSPLVTSSDSDAAAAVGAPDVTNSFVGLVSAAKFRKNKDGMKLGLCKNLVPFSGWSYPGLGLITTKTNSPNAAKLFIHYMMTAEGIEPQGRDGKMSTNINVKLPDSEPSGISEVRNQIMGYDASTSNSDWENRQNWQDLWSLNFGR